MDKLMIDPKEIVQKISQPTLLRPSISPIVSPPSIEKNQTDGTFSPLFMNLSPSFLSYFFIFGMIGLILFMIYDNTIEKKRKIIKKPSYLDKSTNQTKEFLKTMTEKIKRGKEEIIQWFQGFFYKMRVKNKTFSTYRKKRKT